MSNWFIIYHIVERAQYFSKKKNRISFIFAGTSMIIAGTWLVFHLLNAQGIQPFQTTSSNITSYHQEASYSSTVTVWHAEILNWAEEYDLDPLLIATVMQIESCGDPHAVSPAGAQGLFQVMPYHFQPDEDMLDPQTNAMRGLTYLRNALSKSNGDIQLALAGYNGGHTQIDRHPDHWPDETKRYAAWGWGIYQDALLGITPGQTLSAWLDAGGKHLCRQAEINLGLP
jgi:soluble lytic murein transglycosylase-like protein